MTIRRAVETDISAMVRLSDLKRTQYESFSPVFWKKAPEAALKQKTFFSELLQRDTVIALVSEADGIDGFIIANIVAAPPVYDPGGKVCMIDDFVVISPELWVTVGKRLRDQIQLEAKMRGAVLSVTVCGHLDKLKREYLQNADAHIASEWYVEKIK